MFKGKTVLATGAMLAMMGSALAGPYGFQQTPLAAEAVAVPATPAVERTQEGGPTASAGIFTIDEQEHGHLGFAADAPASVMIGIDAPGARDTITIYFPRGGAALTAPARDMIAFAADSILTTGDADVWLSAGPALTSTLGYARINEIKNELMENGIPGRQIRVDDGSLTAALDRPSYWGTGTDL